MNSDLFDKSAEKEKDPSRIDYLDYITDQGKGNCADELIKIRKNAILLRLILSDDEDIPIGASKSGGYPDLPPSMSIPILSSYTKISNSNGSTEHYEASAMQLAAQINLSETAAYDRDCRLPKQGMLYIFWSGELLLENNRFFTYEIEGEDRELFKIFYYGGDLSLLERTKPQLPYYAKYFEKVLDSCIIEPKEAKYMYDSSKLEDILFDEEEEDEELAEKLCEDYERWEADGDKLLGYPTGINIGRPAPGDVNLFQLEWDQGAIDRVCWFISEKDLEERNFSQAYMRVDFS